MRRITAVVPVVLLALACSSAGASAEVASAAVLGSCDASRGTKTRAGLSPRGAALEVI